MNIDTFDISVTRSGLTVLHNFVADIDHEHVMAVSYDIEDSALLVRFHLLTDEVTARFLPVSKRVTSLLKKTTQIILKEIKNTDELTYTAINAAMFSEE